MVNVLIVDDNLLFSKNLINILVKDNPKVRLCSLCTDGEEVLKLINSEQENIDIILLDLRLPNFSGLDILDYIDKKNLTKYEDSIIVISGEMDMLLKLRSNRYLHSFVDKVSGYEKILKEINDLINIKEVEKSSIEYRIHQELKKLNYNFSYVGTKYIIEALLIIYNNYQFDNVKLEKDIYPKISKKYKKSINNIKTNIINATDLMYYDCNSEVLKKYLRILDDTKPTPKIIMSVILEKLIYKD